MAWDQTFFDPIVLPSGKKLITLRDAAEYITELPKAEHDTPEWQAAMEALLLVAENSGSPMFARIGVMVISTSQKNQAPELLPRPDPHGGGYIRPRRHFNLYYRSNRSCQTARAICGVLIRRRHRATAI